jgi:DNA-binding transcriptional ArsR family regulator
MPRATTSNDVFRAIADPTRRAILDRLRAGRPFRSICAFFGRRGS